jgi:squalene-associated FAD-dependent desaturase
MAMHVAIIGAGWAGLAAAVELSRADIQVTLIEAAKQAGGRARRVEAQGMSFDNGQHLLLGAYGEMLRLLEVMGIGEKQMFSRRSLRLEMRSPQHERICIEFPTLPAPWHVVAGFARTKGMSRVERYRALALCTQLFFSGFKLDRDLSVAEWLHRAKQPERLIKALWEPLCLAALNTPAQQASAEIFIHVLHEAFAGERSNADMLFPLTDLGGVFPDPALSFIQRHGGTLRLGERVASLDIRDGSIRGVITRHRDIPVDHAVIATSPSECLRLIGSHPSLNDISRQLAMLRYEPICTVYLQYPPEIRLGNEMMGLLDGMGQWILDLGDTGYPGRMAVVISGPGPHMDMDNDALIASIRHELSRHFAQWPAPSRSFVIREKRATFSCHVGIQALRPASRTPVSGLWLAGDYTDTGLPSTLEGALRSGVLSAQQILATRPAQ